jgi:hypothetical protein
LGMYLLVTVDLSAAWIRFNSESTVPIPCIVEMTVSTLFSSRTLMSESTVV